MAYKQETIKKMLENAGELIRRYSRMNPDDIPLCISNGNTKIGRVMNVSHMPILGCPNCKKCSRFCYDVKACVRFANSTLDARVRNWVILKHDRDGYFLRIEEKINRRRRNKYFRWHVAGDIIDRDYFERMVAIAERHPDFLFWTYTKTYGIVNGYIADGGKIPANLKVMFSEWDGVAMENPYGLPIFTVRLKDGNKNHAREWFDNLFRCPGNCDVCKKLNRGCIAGEDTYNDEH